MTLDLNKNLYSAGWQSPDWIKELRKIESDLADLVANGSVGHNTLTILTRLRNSVHGETLAALAVRGPGRHHDTLVGLPRDAIIEVLDAIKNLGGEKVWGVTERISGRLHADPGVLLEQLFPQVIDLLNSLMARTPIERLPNVNLTPENLLPPADPDSPFSERNRQSIRRQLGL